MFNQTGVDSMQKEIDELREQLSGRMLSFAEFYLENFDSYCRGELTLAQLYMNAIRDDIEKHSAETTAWRHLDPKSRCGRYIALRLKQLSEKSEKNKIATVAEIREYLTKAVRGYDQLVSDLVKTKTYPVIDKETGEVKGQATGLFVDNIDDIPPNLLQYFKSFREVPGAEGFLVDLKMNQADKDRNKCAEMLLKTEGAFIDRTEVTGRNGAPIGIAVAEVSSDELQKICRGLLDEI